MAQSLSTWSDRSVHRNLPRRWPVLSIHEEWRLPAADAVADAVADAAGVGAVQRVAARHCCFHMTRTMVCRESMCGGSHSPMDSCSRHGHSAGRRTMAGHWRRCRCSKSADEIPLAQLQAFWPNSSSHRVQSLARHPLHTRDVTADAAAAAASLTDRSYDEKQQR